MPHNSVNQVPIISHTLVFLLGIAGAIINFAKRDAKGDTFLKKLGLFIVDTITSGTLAIVGFYGALGSGFNELISISVAGIIAHQGTRAFYLLELIVTEKFGAKKTFDVIKANQDCNPTDKHKDSADEAESRIKG